MSCNTDVAHGSLGLRCSKLEVADQQGVVNSRS